MGRPVHRQHLLFEFDTTSSFEYGCFATILRRRSLQGRVDADWLGGYPVIFILPFRYTKYFEMIIFNKLGIPIGPGFANMFPIVNNFRLEFLFFKQQDQQAVPFFHKNIKDLN